MMNFFNKKLTKISLITIFMTLGHNAYGMEGHDDFDGHSSAHSSGSSASTEEEQETKKPSLADVIQTLKTFKAGAQAYRDSIEITEDQETRFQALFPGQDLSKEHKQAIIGTGYLVQFMLELPLILKGYPRH